MARDARAAGQGRTIRVASDTARKAYRRATAEQRKVAAAQQRLNAAIQAREQGTGTTKQVRAAQNQLRNAERRMDNAMSAALRAARSNQAARQAAGQEGRVSTTRSGPANPLPGGRQTVAKAASVATANRRARDQEKRNEKDRKKRHKTKLQKARRADLRAARDQIPAGETGQRSGTRAIKSDGRTRVIRSRDTSRNDYAKQKAAQAAAEKSARAAQNKDLRKSFDLLVRGQRF